VNNIYFLYDKKYFFPQTSIYAVLSTATTTTISSFIPSPSPFAACDWIRGCVRM